MSRSSFSTLSLEDLHSAAIADYKNRFPDADVSRFSDNWKRLRVICGLVLGAHYHTEVVYGDLLPDGAAGAQLDRWGSVLNRPRKPATSATGTALRCFGTSGSVVGSGVALVHRDGTTYVTTSTTTIPAAEYADVSVAATSTGSATNKQATEQLSFTSPPSGVKTVAILQADMTGGFDQESDGDFRQRLLDKLAAPGMGGNRNDYREWALAVTGVKTAYVFPGRQGLGSVDLACLHGGTGAVRLLSGGEIAVVQAAVDAVRPVSVADFRVLTVTENDQDVELRITPVDDPSWDFDWDDSAGWTVSAWNGTTRVLTFTGGARPADLAVGDRITYKSTGAPYGSGAELVVEALGPGAGDVTITTDSLPANPPVASNALYSGGPLVAPIREALQAWFDALGPARGGYASGVWEDTLRLSALYKIAMSVEGVAETAVATPGGNVVPANTAPTSSIELIVARQILVRSA